MTAHNNSNNDLETTAIKALAMASKTPFRTAFKASLGVAAAQLVVLAGFLVLGALAIGVGALILSR